MAVDFLSQINKNGSGLNLTEIAASLVEAETLPKRDAATKKIETAQTSISALGQLKSNLQSLDVAMDVARSFNALSINSSSSEIVAAFKPDTNATEQSAQIEVKALATNQVLEFGGFTSADDTFDGGSLTIEFGRWDTATNSTFTVNSELLSETITIADGTSLSELAAQITKIGGVAARVIDKGDGTVSLGFMTATGQDSAIRMSVTPNAAQANTHSLNTIDTTSNNASVQLQASSDAELTIDGITVFRPTNKIDDLLDGVSLTLSQVTTSPATINIARDENTTSVVMDELVFQLNTITAFLREQTFKSLDGGASGPLAGNTAAETIKRDIQNAIGRGIDGFGQTQTYLSDFGIRTERDGSLSLDSSKMQKQYAANPASFDALFTDGLSSDTQGFTFSGTPKLSSAQNFNFLRDATTGEATLNGATLVLQSVGSGQKTYLVDSGALNGTEITVEDGVNDATLSYGVSFASQLQERLSTLMGSDGALGRQERTLTNTVMEQEDILSALDDRAAMLDARYRSQFGKMETVINQLNSTGEYLTNLIAAWNKD